MMGDNESEERLKSGVPGPARTEAMAELKGQGPSLAARSPLHFPLPELKSGASFYYVIDLALYRREYE